MNLGVTLNYDNQEGLSTDVELGFTNNPILQSLGLNVNIGSSGASGSMTQNGGTMGTVDQDGNYEANENFLGEISGHDIAENNGTLNAQNSNLRNERTIRQIDQVNKDKETRYFKERRFDSASLK